MRSGTAVDNSVGSNMNYGWVFTRKTPDIAPHHLNRALARSTPTE